MAGIRTRPGRPHLLVSRHRTPGRRRAPGAVRRLPDGFSRLSATWAAKSVAAVGVLGGAAVALALPVDASPTALTLAVPAATSSAARADGLAASRSADRAALVRPAPAVSAPRAPRRSPPSRSASPASRPSPSPSRSRRHEGRAAPARRPARPAGAYSTSVSGRCGNLGLINNAARLCSAVDSVFHLGSIGGYRPNARRAQHRPGHRLHDLEPVRRATRSPPGCRRTSASST